MFKVQGFKIMYIVTGGSHWNKIPWFILIFLRFACWITRQYRGSRYTQNKQNTFVLQQITEWTG